MEVIQTDNGSEFGSAFHYHVLDKGVGHRYIKPRTPRLNGKVERSHRIDAEEFYRLLDGTVIDDAKVFNYKLREWTTSTTTAPHGGLGGQNSLRTPTKKTQARVKRDLVSCTLPGALPGISCEDSGRRVEHSARGTDNSGSRPSSGRPRPRALSACPRSFSCVRNYRCGVVDAPPH